MSDDRYDPMSGAQDPAPAVRHRRSERHRGAEEEKASAAPAPQAVYQDEAVEETRQWVRQQPPVISAAEEETYQRPQPQRVVSARDQRYMRPPQTEEEDGEEYDDEEEGGSFPWLKVVLAALLVIAAVCCALFFIKDAGPLTPLGDKLRSLVGTQKEAGQVLSFQTTSNSGMTYSRLQFHVTTNVSVDGVRLEDEDGNKITCESSIVSDEKDTNRIWLINATFEEPFAGDVYAAIREGDAWRRTDARVTLNIVSPTPAPTQTPVSTQVPAAQQEATQAPVITATPKKAPTKAPATATPAPAIDADDTTVPAVTWAPVLPPEVPEEEEEIEEAPTPKPTKAPTAAPTKAPTAKPTKAPTLAPTAAPTASPMPRLDASGVSTLKMTETIYNEKAKAQKKFERETGLIAPNPDQYSRFEIGVFTFRGDNFRRNAAFGTVDVKQEKLSVLWKTPLGGLRTKDYGTLYGVGWTGQPAIIKWPKEVREMLSLNEDKKSTTGLREVIFGAQDGKIYFLDIKDGAATRDPINVGFPLKGSVSVDAMGRPLISVGQALSKLSNKSGSLGMHVINLVDGKKFFINGVKSSAVPAYSPNGAFDGTALFLYDYDTMVVAGENGLLYTIDMNTEFKYPNVEDPDAKGSLAVTPKITMMSSKTSAEKNTLVNVEASVAMYDRYAYLADTYGIVKCVDTDVMKTVWAFDNGDNTDVLALDMEGSSGVSLYTGNTAYSRLGKKKEVSLRKLDALTGEVKWTYNIKCDYDKDQLSGCKASPVVGQHAIADLVIYTVNKVDGGGSRMLALDKETGKVVWEKKLAAESISSPVAVYNDQGDAWIIQGDEGGTLTLLEGRTGKTCATLDLGGKIQGSPAVYKDILVIGTCSKDNACMYGIKIE